MRRAPALMFVLATVASCGPGPVVVNQPPPPPDEGGAPRQAAASPLPVVPIRWEAQPVASDILAPSGVPMSLTSPDGVGLQIASLEAAAVVEDPLAFTELRFIFQNPAPRTIEGRFEIVLPPGATISRFAMRMADGSYQEGEVVELQQARQAYEDFLHRRSDPALLEKQAGNRFQARVFPIPASGQKEIIVSYSQELPAQRDPYRLYLRGLPRLGRFDLRVIEGHPAGAGGKDERRALAFHKDDFVPDRDFVLPVAVPAGAVTSGLRNEDFAVTRITPVAEDRPDPVRDLVVLLDTSASRALDLRTQVERLSTLVAALRKSAGDDMPLAVACFDQELEPMYVGTAGGFGQKEIDAILRRRALGASDLGLALQSAAAFVKKQGGRFSRALLLTDGIPTAGPVEASELAPELSALRDAGIARLDAIVAGGIRDEALLRGLAAGRFPRDGLVLDADADAQGIAERLGRATISGIRVRVPGARWSWPEKLDAVQPGDQALVYANLPAGAPFEVELDGPSGKTRKTVMADFAERPLLERAAARAQIERLSRERDAETDEARRTSLAAEIVRLSTQFRVLSDFTALLVLETEADYARFGIDRRALADILTVGSNGIDLLHRSAPTPAVVAAGPVNQAPEAPGAAPPSATAAPSDEASNAEKKKDSSGSTSPASTATASPEPALNAPPPPDAPPPLSREQLAEERPEPPPPPPPPSQRPVAAKPAPASAGGAPRAATDPSSFGGDDFSPAAQPRPPSRRPQNGSPRPRPAEIAGDDDESEQAGPPPYEGKLLEIMELIQAKKKDAALERALAWHDADPGDVLALIGLGEAFEALGKKDDAARAYGSIIDLFPARADLRRFAGARLERLGVGADGWMSLAVDTFRRARASRPDHPASHRLLAYALARLGKYDEAFEVITEGFVRPYPPDRFRGVRQILADDTGILAAALLRANPSKRAAVEKRLAELGVPLATKPSLRFVLNWETDANDVDFHIHDARGGHAFYSQPRLRSGGWLFADVTTGYGPECFAIEGAPTAYPYRLQAHYYARGPMGYGMGKLEILQHDGRGGLKFDERPFVVMTDRAFVDLGKVTGPLR
jgi:tetratricopeptide (TPR) repeat protein